MNALQSLAWRNERARAAGFEDWDAAIRATINLPQEKAGFRLGVTHTTVRNGRRDAGLRTASPQRDRRWRRVQMQSDPDHPMHGTPNGYNHHRCRCQRCRDAWTVMQADRRAAKRAVA